MERVETSPDVYIASLPADVRSVLEALHARIKTALPGRTCALWEGVFWGGSEQRIIGYGTYTYRRADKTPITWFLVGLARQRNYFSVYVNAVEADRYLAEIYGPRLGKVKTGKSRISFRKLADIDLDVLAEMVAYAGHLVPAESET